MLNKVFLMGRLTRDPELRTTPNGIPTCRISIAVDRNYVKPGEERQADFFDVTCWRSTAEFVCRWFSKGRMILVEGSMQNDNYTDKNGNKVYRNTITADNVSFCGDKGNGGNQNGGYQNNNYAGQPGYGNGGGNYGNGGNYGGNIGNYGTTGQYTGLASQNGNAGGYGNPAPEQNQNGNAMESGDLSDFQVISDGEVPF